MDPRVFVCAVFIVNVSMLSLYLYPVYPLHRTSLEYLTETCLSKEVIYGYGVAIESDYLATPAGRKPLRLLFVEGIGNTAQYC